MRSAIGATEDDAPSPEELASRAQGSSEPRAPLVGENPGPPIAASLAPMEESGRFAAGMIAGAVAMAIDQARAKVGAKLRTKLRGNPDEERLAAVPNSQCAATCQDHLTEIDVDATILDALTPLMQWWESRGLALPSRQARLIVATHVSDTIRSLTADPTPELLASLGA